MDNEPNQKRIIDITIALSLVVMAIIAVSTYLNWKDNIELLQSSPCQLCERQGHIILNKTVPSNAILPILNITNGGYENDKV